MKILVIGDYIEDRYVFGTATRLCPEAPVPVIVPNTWAEAMPGGAGLVTEQLRELTARGVLARYGSFSTKQRIMAGDTLICRIDEDAKKDNWTHPIEPSLEYADAIVVSDYGKGAVSEGLARQLVATGKPLFVDAKHHWHWFEGPNVTIVPNHVEATPVPLKHPINSHHVKQCEYGRVVSKWGKDGCRLNDSEHKDLILPATVTEVVDICGAGDVFMSAFVYAWSIQLPTVDCLLFANILAGESCKHRGTYVVPKQFAQSVLDKLRAQRESVQQALDCSLGSTVSGIESKPPLLVRTATASGVRCGSQYLDSHEGQATWKDFPSIPRPSQTPPESPSVPTDTSAIRIPSDLGIGHEPSGVPPWEG
jgi:D-beta-D-heptose 7-phosphate kinase/D-beta-D-heptose 1-phosphate adenosyltransferase